jgi:DNA-binding transcriptional LysR family regulator
MDASEIEVFLALGDELHFGRAAERVQLSQPRVSRLVASLERRVGGPLFERTSRRVALTPLGVRLRDRVAPAWSELRGALEEARAAARGTNGTLRIGCLVTVAGPALTRLVEEFCACHPDCELTMHVVDTMDPYAALRRGDIDVLVSYVVLDEPDLTGGPVFEYRDRVLLVARGHRLEGRESLSVEDLADEEVHENAPSFPPALYDVIAPPVTPSGRPIRRTYPWRDAEEVLTAVARGQIVHPGAAGTPLTTRSDLVPVPIRDLPPLPLGLVWCTAHENARIRALAAIARRLAPRPRREPSAGLSGGLRVDQGGRVAAVDAGHDRLGMDVVRDRPAALPFVDGQIEGVVGDIHPGDAVPGDGEQYGLDRGALATGGHQFAEELGVLPVQAERDEPAAAALAVDGQVLVDQVDLVAQVGELGGEFFERRQPAQPASSGAVDQHVRGDDGVPAVEFHALEAFVELASNRLLNHDLTSLLSRPLSSAPPPVINGDLRNDPCRTGIGPAVGQWT